jgi:hypothetical protein
MSGKARVGVRRVVSTWWIGPGEDVREAPGGDEGFVLGAGGHRDRK